LGLLASAMFLTLSSALIKNLLLLPHNHCLLYPQVPLGIISLLYNSQH